MIINTLYDIGQEFIKEDYKHDFGEHGVYKLFSIQLNTEDKEVLYGFESGLEPKLYLYEREFKERLNEGKLKPFLSVQSLMLG